MLDGNRVEPLDVASYFAGGIETEEQLDAALDGPIYSLKSVPNYVLLRLDALLSEGEASYDHKIISIEHVLPQSPEEDSDYFTIARLDDRNQLFNRDIAQTAELRRQFRRVGGNRTILRRRAVSASRDALLRCLPLGSAASLRGLHQGGTASHTDSSSGLRSALRRPRRVAVGHRRPRPAWPAGGPLRPRPRLMPSTSGLNAHARPADLIAHLRAAQAVAAEG